MKNDWSNNDKPTEIFEDIIYSYLEMTKEEKGYPKEQQPLVIMDTFKGLDNNTLKELCSKNNCKIVIVPHNFTSKLESLNISVNKAAKSLMQNQYKYWFSNDVSVQLKKGIGPAGIKIISKLSNLKSLHTSWIFDMYKHLSENQEIIANGFDSVWISEVVTKASTILDKAENSFRDVRK